MQTFGAGSMQWTEGTIDRRTTKGFTARRDASKQWRPHLLLGALIRLFGAHMGPHGLVHLLAPSGQALADDGRHLNEQVQHAVLLNSNLTGGGGMKNSMHCVKLAH